MNTDRRVLLAASLGFGVVQLDVSIVNVAVKSIGASLGGGVSGLQWVVDAYTLSFAALIAARSVQGVGAAMLGACTLILLSHAYPSPERRARAIGLWALGASAALAAGPLAGGLLITAPATRLPRTAAFQPQVGSSMMA